MDQSTAAGSTTRGVGAQFEWWPESAGPMCFQLTPCDTDMSSLVIRLSTEHPIFASVFWAGRVRARRLLPMTAL